MTFHRMGNRTVAPITQPEQRQRIQWLVDALRSGRFTQGQGRLGCREKTYDSDGVLSQTYGPVKNCCLGVACEIAIEHGLDVVRGVDSINGAQMERFHYNHDTDFLPEAVRDWYGFVGNNPKVLFDDSAGYDGSSQRLFSVAFLNDGDVDIQIEPLTFEQIAEAFYKTYLESNAHDQDDQAGDQRPDTPVLP